jgi:hypothetical protein
MISWRPVGTVTFAKIETNVTGIRAHAGPRNTLASFAPRDLLAPLMIHLIMKIDRVEAMVRAVPWDGRW